MNSVPQFFAFKQVVGKWLKTARISKICPDSSIYVTKEDAILDCKAGTISDYGLPMANDKSDHLHDVF